jgi:membrane protease YdiL (CAAX protease family)
VYTLGYGFNHRSPAIVEKRLIAHYSYAVMFCLTGFYFLGAVLPPFFSRLLAPVFALASAAQGEALRQLILGVSWAVCIFIPFGLYAVFIGIPRKKILPRTSLAMRHRALIVLAALPVSLLGACIASGAQQVFSAFGMRFAETAAMPDPIFARALYILNLTVLPAVFEELAFRGILMQSLRRFGDGFALICSSLVFAFAHRSLVLMPNAFLMGLVIGTLCCFPARCAWASPFTLRIISSFFC